MSSSESQRPQSKLDTRDGSHQHQHHAQSPSPDRSHLSSFIVTILLLASSILYQAARGNFRPCSLLQFLWDAFVSLIPARLLFAIDDFVNPPPPFAGPMPKRASTRAAKQDAIRRIWRAENGGGGLLNSVSQAGRKGLSSLSGAVRGSSRAVRDRPPGLGNPDNSCYQNSILQGLASLNPLPTYLSAVSLGKKPGLPPTGTADTLRDLLTNLSSATSNGQTLWTPQVLKSMSTIQQQDAQEYYSKLLDQVDNESAKAANARQGSPGLEADNFGFDDASTSQRSDDSGYHSIPCPTPGPESRLARSPLEGLVAQRVACVSCGHCEGLTMIPFNCVTLSLGRLREHDLYERLDHYTDIEPIEGVECPKCSLILCRDLVQALVERSANPAAPLLQRLQVLEEALEDETFDEATLTTKCNIPTNMRVTSTKTKQVALARAPQSLVFHVNRSGFDESTGYMYKNSAAVRFPMVFDLGPWCLGSANAPADLREGASSAAEVEQWTLDPKISMVAGEAGTSRITGPLYELRAVVTHQGHHEYGHYVCYRKHPAPSPPAAVIPTKDEEPEDFSNSVSEDMEMHDATGPASEANESAPGQGEPQSQWWRLSDETVNMVDEQTVLSQGGAFMLFYDRVDPASTLIEELEKPCLAEDAVQDPTSLDAIPASPLADKNMVLAPLDDGGPTDSDETAGDPMQLDDTLPLPGTAGPSLKVPGVESTAGGQNQAVMPDPDLLPAALGTAEMATTATGADCVREATPFFLSTPSLDQLTPV